MKKQDERIEMKAYWLQDRYGRQYAILATDYAAAQVQAAELLTASGLTYPRDVLTLQEAL
jgi:hypothetical protein